LKQLYYHNISQYVVGHCGLFFTNEPEEKVLSFFKEYRQSEFARGGFEATQEVKIPEGPIPTFVHSMEPYLRTQLQLPTSIKNGVVHLESEYEVCEVGQELTPEQAKILKLLGIKMSEFYFDVICVWNNGIFKLFE